MPSPFPGMNPYFERPGIWPGFHGLMLGQIAFALTPQLVPKYFVELESSIYIETPGEDGDALAGVADLALADTGNLDSGRMPSFLQPSTSQTAQLLTGIRRKRHWLSIRDRANRKIISVIELLSPSNKRPGEDRSRYIRKRRRIFRSNASLVELDLLRGGKRLPLRSSSMADYSVLVSRPEDRPGVQLWPFDLDQTFPLVPIPLRSGEAEPVLNLKIALDAVYDGAGYAYRLYSAEPDPRLAPNQREWCKSYLPPSVNNP